jgi:hypothetical protein
VAKHQIELRVAEHKGVALIDQSHLDVVAERFRQTGREFQATESGPKNKDMRLHGAG